MPKNYGPKPLVEEHHHIQELIDRQEVRSQDRIYHQQLEKNRAERTSLIKDSPRLKTENFWCDVCQLDFQSQTIKQEEEDWSCPNQVIAFYKTKCFKEHWCIRFITDKDKDPFWHRSKSVRTDRANHANDLLQSFEEGFNMLYGKQK